MTLDELLALLPDNDTGEIDAADLRTVVSALWERSTPGPAEMLYTLRQDNTSTPLAGEASTDGDYGGLASLLMFNNIDLRGVDQGTSLVNLVVGSYLTLLATNAVGRSVFQVAAPPSFNGIFGVMIPVVALGAQGDSSEWTQAVFAVEVARS